METPKGYTPITLKELTTMSEEDLKSLYSLCYKNGKYRCDTIGITNVDIKSETTENNISYYLVTFSDDDGDPRFTCRDIDDLILDVGDGEWMYGLFKKINKKFKIK
jgi:hypothetical protein